MHMNTIVYTFRYMYVLSCAGILFHDVAQLRNSSKVASLYFHFLIPKLFFFKLVPLTFHLNYVNSIVCQQGMLSAIFILRKYQCPLRETFACYISYYLSPFHTLSLKYEVLIVSELNNDDINNLFHWSFPTLEDYQHAAQYIIGIYIIAIIFMAWS